MTRFLTCVTVLAAMACFGPYSITPARADSWGCSYEKCLAVCAKAGGQRCSAYCTKKLQEKQVSKACPAT